MIVLRPFRAGDEALLPDLANNPLIHINLRDSFPYPYTQEDAEIWISICEKQGNPPYNVAIEVDGELAGGVGVTPGADIYRASAEIGYWLGQPFWGRGIATEALKLWTEQVWRDFPELERLWAGVFAYNAPSMRVLEKAGFVKEAVLRKSLVKNGKLEDNHLFVLFRPAISGGNKS
ncbi:MAG: GNAT family N-acetyltransferase [Siphonobacter aquaeclarae]|nr:GNAT family N-acetyltransferase [Siphonobacter aquaeclarae]